MKKLLSTLALTIFLTIASFLVFNRSRVAVGLVNCNITATGAVQSDGSVSGSPNLGDVYQIQGTVTANYVDDDEVNTSTIVVTAPDGTHTVTSGLFLLNGHVNGTNTYAARIAAGYESKGVWVPGTWTWQINLQDRTGYSCSANGSFTVSTNWNPGHGFLRGYAGTPNIYTDGNGDAFWGMGYQWYQMANNDSGTQYNAAEIPGSALVNVSGTDVSWVSGTLFSTSSQPSSVSNQIYICPTLGSCTYYGGDTVNSSTDLTLPSSGGTHSSVQAYLGFVRNFAVGSDHPNNGYWTTLANAAQFYSQWGINMDRFSDANQYMPTIYSAFNGTGYNNYNYTANGTSSVAWGLPAIDLWFAAAHAAGIHIEMDPNGSGVMDGCSSWSCNSTEQSNLQNYWAMLAARYGAFVDVWELENEQAPPQTWVDLVGSVLNQGVSGIDNGLPVDPYGHLFTVSEFPPGYGTYPPGPSPYGPGTATPDANLTAADTPHVDDISGALIYNELQGVNTNTGGEGCPNVSWIVGTLPRFQGEGPTALGVAPSTQTVQAPHDETNGTRIVDTAYVVNQCSETIFDSVGDYYPINVGGTPSVAATWYDKAWASRTLGAFMQNLDATAAPLSVTLGGGCAGSACTYAALGSSLHVRLALNSATGNAGTGVPNAVTSGTVTFSVPQANMVGQWWVPATGQVTSTFITSSSAGTQTFTSPYFGVDSWLELDPSYPTLDTPTVSAIATSTATLNDTITLIGNASATVEGFNYGTSTSYGLTASSTGTFGAGSFNYGVTGLTPNTTYHFQAFATNSAGTGTSTDATFTTGALTAPVLGTPTVSAIATSTATLSGTITSIGNASATVEGFNYGTSISYGLTASSTGTFGAGSFNYGVTGLTPNTTYHFQAFATNSAGTGTSTDATFTTNSLFKYYRAIMVTSTASVASGTLVNFPMLVSSTFATWESSSTAGGAGHIQNLCTAPNGNQEPCDLVFATSTTNCGNADLNFETESYTSSTGALVDWVNVPTMATGTVIYACYDNSGLGTDQSNPSLTWNSNYLAVFHFADNLASTTVVNSVTASQYGKASTSTKNMATSTGEVDGALNFNGATYVDAGKVTNANATPYTFSYWYEPASRGVGYQFDSQDFSGSTGRFTIDDGDNAPNANAIGVYDSSWKSLSAANTISNSVWQYVTVTMATSTGLMTGFINGAKTGTSTYSDLGSLPNNGNGHCIGSYYSCGLSSFTRGILDEFRIMTTALTPSWIITEYNNQNSPSTFYAVGDETQFAGFAGAPASGFAWGDRAGWVNFGTALGTFQVTASTVTGYAWSQNFGWINLAPSGSGVTNDGLGNLQGYAWSQNAGWLDFSGVTISATGTFVGTASFVNGGASTLPSNTNAGVISFNCSYCLVNTSWRAGASAITISYPVINGSGAITLVPAATTSVSIVASSITDSNGLGSILYATSTLYLSSVAGGANCSNDPLDCYQLPSSSCTFSASTSSVTCTANMEYFAVSTNGAFGNSSNVSATYPNSSWQAAITVGDAAGASTTQVSSQNVDVDILTAASISSPSPAAVNYGNMGKGNQTLASAEPTTTIVNVGNSSATIGLYGTDLTNASSSGYQYYRAITVTSTASVASGTNSNFPMLVSSTLASWESSSTGGSARIQNLCTAPNGGTEPCDLVFATSTANCGTANLNFETESYASSTGALVDWVKVPTMATGTVIYACYDNTAITTDQSHPSSTWTNYAAVYHLPNGTTVSFNDSTANAYNMTSTGFPSAVSGEIDGAAGLTGSNYATTSESTNLRYGTNGFSYGAWVNYTTAATDGILSLVNNNTTAGFRFMNPASGVLQARMTDGSNSASVSSAASEMDGNWHDAVVTANRTSNVLSIYIDGSLSATTTIAAITGSLTDATALLCIGGVSLSGACNFENYTGDVDEVRLTSAGNVLSSSWILTEYNNQNSPSTFYAVGNETFSGSGGSIAVTNEHFATSSFTYGGAEQALSYSSTTIPGFVLTAPTSTNSVSGAVYWGLNVPSSTPSGTYNGVNTFVSTFSP